MSKRIDEDFLKEFAKAEGITDSDGYLVEKKPTETTTEEQEKQLSPLKLIIAAQQSGILTDDILKEIAKMLTSDKNKAPEWIISGKNGYTVNEPKFIKTFCKDRDLHCINESFYDINGATTETALKKEIQNKIQEYIFTGIARKTENIFKALQISVSEDNFSPDLREIHLLNGVLHVDGTFTHEKRFCLNRLKIAYDKNAPKPEIFLNCLHDMLEDDDILTLQEYMGYCLIPETAAQKCLSVIGSGGEGKSTVIGTALKTIFEGNIVCEGIDKLATDKFILNDIENKLVYFDDDIKAEKLTDTSMVKKIVTNKGNMHIEGKFKSRHAGNIYARVIMFGNNCLQALYDTSNGFFRRQLIIQTKPKTRPDAKDISGIATQIQTEMQGIFNWCFAGLQRLISNDFKFTISEKSKKALETLKNESLNIACFLEERFDFNADNSEYRETTADIYTNYEWWCFANAETPLKKKTVTNYLAANCKTWNIEQCSKVKDSNGIFVRGYSGLKLKTKETTTIK